VLDAMFELKVQPQEHVIDQGDDGDNFYVIERYEAGTPAESFKLSQSVDANSPVSL